MNAIFVSRQLDARDERSLRSNELVPTRRVARSSSTDDEGFAQKTRDHLNSPQRSVRQYKRSQIQRVDRHDGCVTISQELARRRSKGAQRRGSLRSIYTESSEGSVSFSSTKLGQLLNKGGYRLDKDFEVETKSPDLVPREIDQNPVSPRSALVRQSMPGRIPKGRPVNLLSNENPSVRDAFEPEKLRPLVRRQISDLSTLPNRPRLSDTKIGRMLAKKGLKLEPEFRVARKGPKFEPELPVRKPPSLHIVASNFDKEQQREECAYSDSGGAPSLSGSDITPTTDSEHSVEPVANQSIVEQPFVPISERVPVEVLKARMEAKAAKKQDIINKIKMMDSRLSTMLSACHEASRKLKMMDIASMVSDGSDISSIVTDVSDVSF